MAFYVLSETMGLGIPLGRNHAYRRGLVALRHLAGTMAGMVQLWDSRSRNRSSAARQHHRATEPLAGVLFRGHGATPHRPERLKPRAL